MNAPDHMPEVQKNPCIEGGIHTWTPINMEGSMIASLARSLRRARTAVEAVLREHWSAGQIEGQIHRLKTLKRQVHGRANIDLLGAWLLAAS